jgi:biopolymer transport protein ExbD
MSRSQGLFAGETGPRKKRALSGGDLDLTPMIDVTFLLLIFFMVCSTMKSVPDLDLPVATHAVGAVVEDSIVFTLKAGTTGEPSSLLLGDGQGEEINLNEVAGFVKDAVASGRMNAIVKAEGDVSAGDVEALARAIQAVEGVTIYIGVGDAPPAAR